MATHSRILAWRIPGSEDPSGLPSMGSQRVGHDWCDLAAAAAAYLLMVRDREAWPAADHGGHRVRQDLVTEQQHQNTLLLPYRILPARSQIHFQYNANWKLELEHQAPWGSGHICSWLYHQCLVCSKHSDHSLNMHSCYLGFVLCWTVFIRRDLWINEKSKLKNLKGQRFYIRIWVFFHRQIDFLWEIFQKDKPLADSIGKGNPQEAEASRICALGAKQQLHYSPRWTFPWAGELSWKSGYKCSCSFSTSLWGQTCCVCVENLIFLSVRPPS